MEKPIHALKDLFAQKKPEDVDVEVIKQRLLVTIALEAARTMEEGIVTDPREADVGSILGFGFAPYTGGTLSYIDGMVHFHFPADRMYMSPEQLAKLSIVELSERRSEERRVGKECRL